MRYSAGNSQEKVSKTTTWSYDGKTPLKTAGMYEAIIKANGKQTIANIHVFYEGHGNLLSFDTCCELDICNPKDFIFAVSSDQLQFDCGNIKKKPARPIKKEKSPIILTRDQELYKANIFK